MLDPFKGPAIASGLIASILVGVLFVRRYYSDRAVTPTRPALAEISGVNGTPNDANWQAAVGDNYEFGDCLARCSMSAHAGRGKEGRDRR